ncbi:MAG: hypothetical protein IPP33_03635 [Flavobacteriales bacterium]|nr:hypothetical protein [Flavobacteriales bacterium]
MNQALSSLVWMRNYGGSGGDETRIMVQDPVSNEISLAGTPPAPTPDGEPSTKHTRWQHGRLSSALEQHWCSLPGLRISSAASSSAQVSNAWNSTPHERNSISAD